MCIFLNGKHCDNEEAAEYGMYTFEVNPETDTCPLWESKKIDSISTNLKEKQK
jgi:hypothetical protein